MVEIMYAHHDGGAAGSTISLRNLLLGLDRGQFMPRVALFSDGPARDLFESLGVPVDIVPARPFWTCPGNPWTKLGFYYNFLALLPNRNLLRYLKERKPDLVHVNDKACLQAGVAAHKLGISVVWHLRSSYAPAWSRLQARLSADIIRKNANALIAISEDETDGFEDCPSLRIINNSLDFAAVNKALLQTEKIRADLGIRVDELVVGLVVAQVNWVRGAWDFLEMAGQVIKQTSAALKFVIVGPVTDDAVAQAQGLARHYGILERLILTGFRSDALAAIAAFDILVVCNHHGVLGRPPLEAMAVGTPVVAWHGHSQRSSIVKEGETALLAPRGDVAALAQLVVKLIENVDIREKMGKCGVQYAREHFDPQFNARKVEDVYENMLRRKSPYATRIAN